MKKIHVALAAVIFAAVMTVTIILSVMGIEYAQTHSVKGLYQQSERLYTEKNYHESLAVLENLINTDPKDERGYIGKAWVLKAMNRDAEALEVLSVGLEKAKKTQPIEQALADIRTAA
jgi:tetratricopeptide (TPR) repeat protein